MHSCTYILCSIFVKRQVVNFDYNFVFLLSGIKIIEGPSDVILVPPETVTVFSCNVSHGMLPIWVIDGRVFFRNQEYPTGHVLNGFNLNVTMGINGTEYRCLIILSGTFLESSTAFLYIAGKFMYVHAYVRM